MKFEIVNPSDPYTMEADDLQIAAVAVCLLGNGKYMAKGQGRDDGQDVPFFLFGGVDEWFIEKFGMDYGVTASHALNNRNDGCAVRPNADIRTRVVRTNQQDRSRHG